MQYLWFVLAGALSGILGGMGMGGGTLLIPLLSLLLSITQKQAQLLNVFSFVIMSIFVIYVHFKNKLIKVFPALVFSFFGTIFATFSACFVRNIPSDILKLSFGIFLLILSIVQFVIFIIKKKQIK